MSETIKVKPMTLQRVLGARQMMTLRPKVKFNFQKAPKAQIGSSVVQLAGGKVNVLALRNPGNGGLILPKGSSTEKPTGWVCNTTQWTGDITSPEMAILNPNYGSMYPGAIYDYTSIANGSYQGLPHARKPITVTVDGQKFKNPTVKISQPSSAAYNTALAKMKDGQRAQGGARTVASAFELLAEEDLFIRTAGAGNFLGFGGKHAVSYKDSSKSHKYYLNIVQAYYTVSVDDSINEPSDFFITKAEQPSHPDAVALPMIDPNWVFVDNVVYGRMLQVLLESDESLSTVDLDISAYANVLVAGGEASLSTESRNLLRKVSIKVAAVGGEANASAKIANGDILQLKNRIDAYFAGSGDEEPIAYSLRTLDGAVVGSRMTTEFTSRQCAPVPTHYQVTWENVLCLKSTDQNSASNPEDCQLLVRIRAWDGGGSNILDSGKVNAPIVNADKVNKSTGPNGFKVPVPWTYVRGNSDHPIELATGDSRDMSHLKLKFPVAPGDKKVTIGIRADVHEFDGAFDGDDNFADEAKSYSAADIGPGRTVKLLTTDGGSKIEFKFRIDPVYA